MSGAIFFRPLRVERIPPAGKHVRIEANEEERRAVAAALGIVDLTALAAEVDVRRQAGDAVAVKGKLSAHVVQTDVVTLDPVAQDVAEEIDVTLTPAEDVSRGKGAEPAPAEERDLYSHGEIDLGSIAVEHLALGLDPYPRAAGAAFSDHIEDDSVSRPSPFAALGHLKRDRE
jgi:hypothetical protein